jgi:excisionase family DNA binding protein
MKKTFYNLDETSEFLRISRSTLYEMINNRKIPHYKDADGRSIFFKKDELVEFLGVEFFSEDAINELKEEEQILSSLGGTPSSEQKSYLRFFLEKVDVI